MNWVTKTFFYLFFYLFFGRLTMSHSAQLSAPTNGRPVKKQKQKKNKRKTHSEMLMSSESGRGPFRRPNFDRPALMEELKRPDPSWRKRDAPFFFILSLVFLLFCFVVVVGAKSFRRGQWKRNGPGRAVAFPSLGLLVLAKSKKKKQQKSGSFTGFCFKF